MKNVKRILENIGLKKKEIMIYLALIKKESSALQIAKDTGIDRTTIYDILRKLMDKGIVSQVHKGKTTHFMTLPPNDLVAHYQRKFQSLKGILPELNRISGHSVEPIKCEMFQGKEGMINVIKDLVMSKCNYKAIGIRKEYEELIGYFHKQFLIKIDLMRTKETAIVEKNSKFKKAKNGSYRYVNIKLPATTTIIYKDTVVFFIWEGPYTAIRIKNKSFKEAQEKQFNMLWKLGKAY